MGNKIQVATKGYCMIIKSWETDRDFEATITIPIVNLEQAAAFKEVCEYCRRDNAHADHAIANQYIDTPTKLMRDTITELQSSYPLHLGTSYEEFIELTNKLFGCSEEGYLCRVCDDYTVAYSATDLFIEEITDY